MARWCDEIGCHPSGEKSPSFLANMINDDLASVVPENVVGSSLESLNIRASPFSCRRHARQIVPSLLVNKLDSYRVAERRRMVFKRMKSPVSVHLG